MQMNQPEKAADYYKKSLKQNPTVRQPEKI
jgi:hypothetical protein